MRCAGASGSNVDIVPEGMLGLAWYCIQLLLSSIWGAEKPFDSGKVEGKQVAQEPHDSIEVEEYFDSGREKGKEIAQDAFHSGNEKGKQKAYPLDPDETAPPLDQERLHRLRLMLISAVPSLPVVLMLQALEQIKTIIISTPPPNSHSSSSSSDTQKRRGELVKNLFDEIVGLGGNKEKSAAMKWWYENKAALQYGPEAQPSSSVAEKKG